MSFNALTIIEIIFLAILILLFFIGVIILSRVSNEMDDQRENKINIKTLEKKQDNIDKKS